MNFKQRKKRVHGKCYFCEENDYSLLDVHRIVPGSEGGKYVEHNTIVLCANCHRKVHSNKIEIIGRHFSTTGRHVIHYREEGAEKWL